MEREIEGRKEGEKMEKKKETPVQNIPESFNFHNF